MILKIFFDVLSWTRKPRASGDDPKFGDDVDEIVR